MKVVLFCHSVLSDWNNGNAHFQRGVASELAARGHAVTVYEPEDAWSAENLVRDHGAVSLAETRSLYPQFEVRRYASASLDLECALDGAGLVIVHEWNSPELIASVGRHRAGGGRYRLLFHDTHHRSVSAPEQIQRFDFTGYDAILAFGEALRQRYQELGWGGRAFTWHEAADTRVFYPRPAAAPAGDVVWIGNWGDEERSKELREFLLGPIRTLGLRARVHGVRYPEAARAELQSAGIELAGWLPNYRVPEVFAGFRATVHVPRRPYAERLTGIPTIRPFEALACGIPLISAPWHDAEGLFRTGLDYLLARDGAEMTRLLRAVLLDADLSRALIQNGRDTLLARHTCKHRVDELIRICRAIGASALDLGRRAAPAARPRREQAGASVDVEASSAGAADAAGRSP